MEINQFLMCVQFSRATLLFGHSVIFVVVTLSDGFDVEYFIAHGFVREIFGFCNLEKVKFNANLVNKVTKLKNMCI